MEINAGSVVYGKNRTQYKLEQEIGSGGEGTVYKVSGQQLAAKIYKKVTGNIEQKILYMIDHRVDDLYDQAGNPVMQLVWPVDALYAGNMFIGYVMPLSQGGIDIFHIARGEGSLKTKAAFPKYTRMHNVVTARNLAAAIDHIHAHGYVVGDMNCKNILVGQKCHIIILDNDSFDFTDKVSGTHYKCEAATCEYLAPELHGINLRDPRAVFTRESDNFSLAIHIFQLLMNNYHPFTGRNTTVVKDSSSENQQAKDIQQGRCPFVRNIPGLSIPIGAPYLNEMVTNELIQDFKATFIYDFTDLYQKIPLRTTARKWREDLDRFLGYFDSGIRAQCPNCSTHVYPRILGGCGICAANKRFNDFVNRPPQPVPSKTPVAPKPPVPPQPPKPAPKYHIGLCFVIMLIALVLAYLFSNPSDHSSGRDHSSYSDQDYSSSFSQDYDSSYQQDHTEFNNQGEPIYGSWAENSISLENWNVYPFILDTEVRDCTRMDVTFDVQMNYNTRCEWWTLWLRTSKGWVASGSIYLPGGDGRTDTTIELSRPMSFTQIVVTPQAEGSYSFSYGMAFRGYYD